MYYYMTFIFLELADFSLDLDYQVFIGGKNADDDSWTAINNDND